MKKVLSLIAVLSLLLFLGAPAGAVEQPKISKVHLDGANIIVDATVPAGIIKVTLQSRDRVDGSAWVPRAVARLEGTVGGTITFTLPLSAKLELLRVRADDTDPLPASFYKGTNTFTPEAGSAGGGGGAVLFDGNGAPTTELRDENGGNRTVVESDIWKIDGDTIYFFNTYRGLQVIDIANPSTPAIKATFEIPALGEQMYLHRNHAVLLARNGCGWWGNDSESRVVIVNVGSPELSLAASLPVQGWIQESRLVGDVLYVASQTYRQKATATEVWEWGTVVQSFDLADPANPITRGTLWFSGYGNTIAATDEYLFVVTTLPDNWNQSVLNLVDISSATGEMAAKGAIQPNGRIADKFKMHQQGDTLTVISHGLNPSNQWVSILQTFSIANPLEPVKLATLELAPNEQLHATRFDGNRVYIVTFFRIDPLWIVDLTDPAKPVILSELEVPGFSTYLHPMGDRLLAVGIDPTNSWRTTISLFDVADPAKPSLLDREFLGEGYSWSEANSDEKAFNVLTEAGLILVPYTGNVANGYVNQVQLIDFDNTSLTKRGVIDHRLQPRRATLQDNHVLSISGRELISVDASNRDLPEFKAELALSWSVDRVLTSGDHVIQIESANYYWWNAAATKPRLLVSSKNDPSKPVSVFELPRAWTIAGATLKDGFIYLAQTRPPDGLVLVKEGEPQPGNLITTVLDARNLPELKQSAVVESTVEDLMYGSLEALWPKPNLLVWSTGEGWGGWWWWRGGFEGDVLTLTPPVPTRQAALMMPWWGGGSYGRMVAFNVPQPGQLQFASSVNLSGTNNWWNFSKSIVASSGLVYASHQSSEYLPDVIAPWSRSFTTYDPATGETIINDPPKGMWITKHFLDVVDFADPAHPVVRPPVNIPGVLKDSSHDGAMVYTVYYHYGVDFTSDYSEFVDALAYDGVAAHLVDSLKLPTEWPRSYDLANGNLFLSKSNSTNPPPVIEHWRVGDAGKFALQAQAVLSQAAQNIAVVGDLLAVVTANAVQIYPVAGIGIPKPVGSVPSSSCFYSDLQKAQADPGGLWLPLGDYGLIHVPYSNR